MKARLVFLISICIACMSFLRAQPVPPALPAQQVILRTGEQLGQMLGPIALYPDALVALIMPAATIPSDIVLASRYLAVGGAPENIATQPWDESVKSLAHYPEIIKWMDDNLEWTRELGETFLTQPADVLKAVQRLRSQALAAGTLINTPQQQIVREGEDICIVPAQPNVIYVPRYDPEVVYVRSTVYYSEPLISFGLGFAVGAWLTYDCDWGQRLIWVGRRDHGWRASAYGRPHYVNDPDWRHWKPSPRVHAVRPNYYQSRPEVVRPRPFTGMAPHANRQHEKTPERAVRVTQERHEGNSGRIEPRDLSQRDMTTHVQSTLPVKANPVAAGHAPEAAGPHLAPPPKSPAVQPVRSRDDARQGNIRDNSVRQPVQERDRAVHPVPAQSYAPQVAPSVRTQTTVQPTRGPKAESKDPNKDHDKNLNN